VNVPVIERDDDRTPPKIVAASVTQVNALLAFVAQELEHWGFGVTNSPFGLIVNADGYEFEMRVRRVR
jgi:hypothetical protein